MQVSLAGKVAVVTGAAQGIGAAIARMMAEAGAAVIVADVSPKGETVVEELRAQGFRAVYQATDVRSPDDVRGMIDRAVAEFGGLDALVNCAGVFPVAPFLETTPEFWDRVLDINLKGVFLACQAAAPALARRGGGVIVNIGSLHATAGSPERLAYAVSKGGVVTLTRNLARSLAHQRIRVNCVHPGWVASEGEIELRRALGSPEGWQEEAGRQLPFGRLQTPEDVAAMVVFLASDLAEQVTGQVVAVSGRADGQTF